MATPCGPHSENDPQEPLAQHAQLLAAQISHVQPSPDQPDVSAEAWCYSLVHPSMLSHGHCRACLSSPPLAAVSVSSCLPPRPGHAMLLPSSKTCNNSLLPRIKLTPQLEVSAAPAILALCLPLFLLRTRASAIADSLLFPEHAKPLASSGTLFLLLLALGGPSPLLCWFTSDFPPGEAFSPLRGSPLTTARPSHILVPHPPASLSPGLLSTCLGPSLYTALLGGVSATQAESSTGHPYLGELWASSCRQTESPWVL